MSSQVGHDALRTSGPGWDFSWKPLQAQAATKAVEDHALDGLSERDQHELRRLLRQVMTALGLFVPQ